MRRNATLSLLFLVVGALALTAGVLATYVRDSFGDSAEFADRAQTAFAAPEVRSAITQATVTQIVEAEPDLLAVRPLLVTVVDGVLATETANTLFRGAVYDLHRTLFTDDEDTLILQVSDLILVAKSQVSALDPELGAQIPDDLTDGIIEVRAQAQSLDGVQLVEQIDVLSLVLSMVALASFVASAWFARSASAATVRIGVAIVISAVAVMLAANLARVIVIDADHDVQAAVWEAFVDPLDAWVLGLGALGAILAAVAWFGVDSMAMRPRLEQVQRLARRREDRWGRIVWGLAVVAGGLVVVLEAMRILRLAVVIVGVGLVVAGVRELAGVVAPSFVRGASDEVEALPEEGEEQVRSGIRLVVSVLVFLVGTAVIVGAWLNDGAADADEDAGRGCNGSVVLCDRPFDEVVMAATHNSNAAAEEGFVNGYQTVGIEQQLRDGVRGFLIDVYWGFPTDQLVVTDRAPLSDAERDELVADVGESAVVAAEATAATFEASGVEAELYLCHALCEIGASPFVDELEKMRAFLDVYDHEVISIIIQDEGPQPDDIAEAFEQAGMLEMLHVQNLGSEWPTLGEMIDSGRRVFVSAENVAGGYDWYHDAFTYVQDTPFKFGSLDEFSCELFRGEEDSPLFLVNHWLSPVSPRSADTANSSEVLDARVDDCGDVRDRLPNMIAVDFHDRGDVLAFVRALNLR